MTNDVTIIGGGIVGLATAHALVEQQPGRRITVLDKERHWGAHQTGHNSGVIHSGLYYPPGSAKARFARAGGEAMYRFCTDHGIPVRRTGKVVVATSIDQLPRLAELERRGRANGVAVGELDLIGLREREPNVRGVRALHVPDAGITDFAAVSEKLAELLAERGVELRPATELQGVRRDGGELVLLTDRGEIRSRRAVNCAGLHSDAVAELAGTTPPARILPFRGEYYETTSFSRDLVNSLVYPVPDPAFPFLGVHLTRMIDGSLHVGPNAVPALSREGYRWGAVSPEHLKRLVTDPGLRVLAKKYWRTGATEIARSALKPLFLRAARTLLPDLRGHDLLRSEAGVRAQAVTPEGTLVDDFLVVEDEHWVHVLNAPSPAATASLLIGKDIATRLD
ncbi:L-2-hydroxyglutarate oxidase [Saccharopolyspora sp. TS4A08]|uniref:L-2-hydroxyglutarate oxidase n=1 Tax=Saccharopolyspora ipomoeae TaxID=3042027 RepID=A0ABT6PY81_9PSEU|nr:L-2-hydroxyglutarate oxidase [Saccharopolyspora sp. TS4A08]MDI2032827.1 L-2-hydroxyglutarate oxidase [Saccharopolyspora sp. TS4A08]